MDFGEQMCKDEKESGEHILLHCTKARILWQLVFSLFGIAWVLHSSIKTTLLTLKLAWTFHWEEEEDSLKSRSFMFILDYLERKK